MSIKLSEIINSVTDAETTARMSYDSTLAANISAAGTVPLGAVIAVVEYQNVSIPATETIDSRGFQLCDGANLAVGHALGTGQSGKVPNLSDGRYLRGSTVSGTVGGANTATIGSANLPTHTHAVGTLANAAEASHTHAVGTYANAAEAAHTHTKSGSVGAGSSHTHADTISYGAGSSLPTENTNTRIVIGWLLEDLVIKAFIIVMIRGSKVYFFQVVAQLGYYFQLTV
jgi:microcystin-dependent protein